MIESIVITKVNRDREGKVVSAKVCFFNENGEEAFSLTLEAPLLKDINFEKIPTEISLTNIIKR